MKRKERSYWHNIFVIKSNIDKRNSTTFYTAEMRNMEFEYHQRVIFNELRTWANNLVFQSSPSVRLQVISSPLHGATSGFPVQ